MIVDDDVDSVTSFAALLELEGASVSTTTSASEALKMLAEGGYDLLLSDIGMPEMSGLELMKRARELRPNKHFRSVAITGYGSEADARDARAAGFEPMCPSPSRSSGCARSSNRFDSCFSDVPLGPSGLPLPAWWFFFQELRQQALVNWIQVLNHHKGHPAFGWHRGQKRDSPPAEAPMATMGTSFQSRWRAPPGGAPAEDQRRFCRAASLPYVRRRTDKHCFRALFC